MKRNLALWTGVLTGPIVWFVSFEAKFAISWWICASRWKPAAYGISLLALAITFGAGALSWSQWKQLPRANGSLARPQFLAMSGVMLSAGFLLVLVAQTLPELLLNGCE